jgi:hypothetical protein
MQKSLEAMHVDPTFGPDLRVLKQGWAPQREEWLGDGSRPPSSGGFMVFPGSLWKPWEPWGS